jgi:hypothetical protein
VAFFFFGDFVLAGLRAAGLRAAAFAFAFFFRGMVAKELELS